MPFPPASLLPPYHRAYEEGGPRKEDRKEEREGLTEYIRKMMIEDEKMEGGKGGREDESQSLSIPFGAGKDHHPRATTTTTPPPTATRNEKKKKRH